jgi:hypothetical protein
MKHLLHFKERPIFDALYELIVVALVILQEKQDRLARAQVRGLNE